ncbi:MAG: hypothetical protein JWM95_4532 [Gemmatimonadetes bacterium]|nr:hypothetical protein [Gemmatimonadota bacterium]
MLRIFVLATLLARMAHAQAAGGHAGDVVIDAQLDRLRAATKSFQNLDSAVAAGYPRDVADCLIHEHHGAMGYHHLNRSYLSPTLDLTRPQILLYEKRADGSYKLNGMEFIIPYRLYPRDSAAPVLLGQKLAHEDTLNIWYLHVWAWTNNADGVFANFNPAVSCGTAGKVYTPFSRDMLQGSSPR